MLDDLGEFQRRSGFVQIGDRSDKIILRLDHVRRFNSKKRLSGLDRVAGLGKQFDDPAGIGREDQRGTVFIDADFSFGHMLGAEHDVIDRRRRQRGPLLWRRIVQRAFVVALGWFRCGHCIHGGRAGCSHREPRTNNDNDRGDHAIARIQLRSQLKLRHDSPDCRSGLPCSGYPYWRALY